VAAAAAVLVEERGDIADAAGKGARSSKRALGITGNAVSHATEAAIDVIRKSARDVLPEKLRPDAKESPRQVAVH